MIKKTDKASKKKLKKRLTLLANYTHYLLARIDEQEKEMQELRTDYRDALVLSAHNAVRLSAALKVIDAQADMIGLCG